MKLVISWDVVRTVISERRTHGVLAAIVLARLVSPASAEAAVAYSVADCRGGNQSLTGNGSVGAVLGYYGWFDTTSYHYLTDSRGALYYQYGYRSGPQYATNVVTGDWRGYYFGSGPWSVLGLHRLRTLSGYWYLWATTYATDCAMVLVLDPNWMLWNLWPGPFWWWPAPTNRIIY
jgi:hypothetical protein